MLLTGVNSGNMAVFAERQEVEIIRMARGQQKAWVCIEIINLKCQYTQLFKDCI